MNRNTKNHPVRTDRMAVSLVPFICLLAVTEGTAVAANITVGSGTPQSCSESALHGALTSATLLRNGRIKFDCGNAPITIVLHQYFPIPEYEYSNKTAALVLTGDTEIDGGGLVTIRCGAGTSSSPAGKLAFVQADATVAFKHLDLQGCGLINDGTLLMDYSSLTGGVWDASLIRNNGALTLKRSAVSDSYAFFSTLFVNTGIVTMKDSELSRNYIDGGLIGNGGSFSIIDSEVSRNFGDHNGGIYNVGELSIKGSVFSSNRSGYFRSCVTNDGSLTIKDSTFADNTSSYFGSFLPGCVGNGGVANISNTSFIDNDHGGYGGALFNSGTLTVTDSTFLRNTAARRGGAIANFGALTMKGGTVTENAAGEQGGGIYSYGGTLQLKSTVVTNNTPDNVVTIP